MKSLFLKLGEVLSRGKAAVLASVIHAEGSVPRGSGAGMLVTDEGLAAGTIGGGRAEYEAILKAQELLKSRENASEIFRLYQNDIKDIDSICGGDIEVFFRYIEAGDKETSALCEKITAAFDEGRQCWLLEETGLKNGGLLTAYFPEEETGSKLIPEEVKEGMKAVPTLTECDGRQFYTERLVAKGRVFIFGGGHVSRQLVPTLARCDFRCIVIEDRPEFADPALFENLCETKFVTPDDLEKLAGELNEDDYVCIMTRGHRNDYECVAGMLRSKACYIGVIGSRTKIASVRERLKGDGFSDADLSRLTMPIGIEIYSETPAEIAVSIAAQLIMVRALRSGTRKAKKHPQGSES